VFQFQKRKALPESSGSHTHAVEDLDVAATESTQLMRKRIEPFPECTAQIA
jgi:hypothetical protein